MVDAGHTQIDCEMVSVPVTAYFITNAKQTNNPVKENQATVFRTRLSGYLRTSQIGNKTNAIATPPNSDKGNQMFRIRNKQFFSYLFSARPAISFRKCAPSKLI